MRIQSFAVLAMWLSACGGASVKSNTAAASAPGAAVPPAASDSEVATIAPEEAARFSQLAAPPPESAPQSPPQVGGAAPAEGAALPAPPAQMLDIEARLSVRVRDVAPAVERFRASVAKLGGQVVEESRHDEESSPRAQLTVRVPSQTAEAVFSAVETLGAVISRQVTTRDLGKQYYDAALRLQNLQWVLARYEQILARANTVDEVLRVEEHLARVRGDIEQLKGELRWMRDRAARATLHLTLVGPEVNASPRIREPEANFYPGIRASYLADFRGDDGRAGYLGAGLSLRLSRHFSVDVEGLRGTESDTAGLDLFLATVGGELYSEFLGGGQRRWANPYVGFRGGYARFLGNNEAAAGVTVGLEIFKTEMITVDAEIRAYGMFGSDAGAHLTMQPAIGANVAF
jgi:hypothetical protein